MSEDFVTRKEFEEFKKTVKAGGGVAPKDKKPRKPTEFNLFVGKEIGKICKEFPELEHGKRFSMAVERWNEKKGSGSTKSDKKTKE